MGKSLNKSIIQCYCLTVAYDTLLPSHHSM